MCSKQKILLLLLLTLCAQIGRATIPILPEAIQLLQLESIKDLENTVEDQHRLIADQEAIIAKLDREKTEMEVEIKREREKMGIKVKAHQAALSYMTDVMLQSNKLMREQQKTLESQANMIKETSEEVKRATSVDKLCREGMETIAIQSETIQLLKSSLATATNFSNLTTTGLDQLNLAPFMLDLMESYNKQTKILGDLNLARENDQLVKDKVCNMTEELAEFTELTKSANENLALVTEQSEVISMQSSTIAQLTPLLRHNSSNEDLVGNDRILTTVSSLETASDSEQLIPIRIEYQCAEHRNR